MNIKPKTYTKMVAFKITPEEYEILKVISEEEKRTSSDLFRSFIKQKQKEIEWTKMELQQKQTQLI